MKIKLKFCLINIKEPFYWEKMVKNGEYRSENWVKLWAQIELSHFAALYTTNDNRDTYLEASRNLRSGFSQK